MLDTVYPFGVFKPIQLLALPAAGLTAAFCEFLGYPTVLRYPVPYQGGFFPRILISAGGKSADALIGWPCAGVHSMFLYILIMLVFFKRSEISGFRKLTYFVVGAIGTYFVNILRIFTYLFIYLNYDKATADLFHNSYGELYFFAWILLFILLIFCIQRFRLVERTPYAIRRLAERMRHVISRLGSRLHLRKTESLKPNAIP
jgi:exosortase/archaeosortase family protein